MKTTLDSFLKEIFQQTKIQYGSTVEPHHIFFYQEEYLLMDLDIEAKIFYLDLLLHNQLPIKGIFLYPFGPNYFQLKKIIYQNLEEFCHLSISDFYLSVIFLNP